MGFMLHLFISRSKAPIECSRVYVMCPSLCHHVTDPPGLCISRKEIYLNVNESYNPPPPSRPQVLQVGIKEQLQTTINTHAFDLLRKDIYIYLI